jgi:hypothetical protein
MYVGTEPSFAKILALASRSSGIISACEVMGREIESRQDMGLWLLKERKKRARTWKNRHLDGQAIGRKGLWIQLEEFQMTYLKVVGASALDRGCQMVYLHIKNPNLGKFWRALEWKMFLYFIAILSSFSIPISPRFSMFYQEKYVNPALDRCTNVKLERQFLAKICLKWINVCM